jgi:CheY-like chemotaxis protein
VNRYEADVRGSTDRGSGAGQGRMNRHVDLVMLIWIALCGLVILTRCRRRTDTVTRTQEIQSRLAADSAATHSQEVGGGTAKVTGIPQAVPVGRAGTRLLLVDDSDAIIEALTAVFALTPGFSVCGHAGTIAVALDLAVATGPDAILLDEHLPDGLGSDAIPRFRQRCPDARIVLHCGDVQARHRAQVAGADAFVAKGESLAHLTQALRSRTHGPL